METKEFTIERELDAPRETVWQAWTDPVLAARWWHPHEVVTPPESVVVDVREGGRYRYLMVAPDGREYPTGGEFIEVREPERLRFSWAEPGADVEDAYVITVDLRELPGGRCAMTFHLQGRDEDRGRDDSVHDGWVEAFEELDALLVQR